MAGLKRDSSTPDEPFYLSFLVDALLPRRTEERVLSSRRYVAADGSVTEDPQAASIFVITPSGQLMNTGGYISTAGVEEGELFRVSPEVKAISTRFTVRPNSTLTWENDAFVGGEAIFCLLGDLYVRFDGTAPPGCGKIDLTVTPEDEITLPPTSTLTTSLIASTAATSTISVPTYPPGTSSTTSLFFSSTPDLTLTTTTTPIVMGTTSFDQDHTSSTSVSEEIPPSSTASTSLTSDFPAPTSTGTPNCFDGAGFDGTVNSDYLILCDTELPGSTLDAVPAADLAECIEACNSYVPTSDGICVAVEFDIVSHS